MIPVNVDNPDTFKFLLTIKSVNVDTPEEFTSADTLPVRLPVTFPITSPVNDPTNFVAVATPDILMSPAELIPTPF